MENLAIENPSLQMINSNQIKAISEWEEMYPETWMLIEVTREDLYQVYEGKLLALAKDPLEFVDLKKSLKASQIVNLTTRGHAVGEPSAVWTKL